MDEILTDMEAFEPNSKTMRTRRNIYSKLKQHLTDKYNKPELTNTILKAHGLDSKRFDMLAVAENFTLSKINDISVDPNANKNEMHTESIIQECINPLRKLYGYDLLYRTMKSLYGKEKADELSMSMYDYSLALADSTKVEKCYCWAISTSFLVTEGRSFGVLPSTPAQRLDSYIAALNETVHMLSAHLAGAVGLSTVFVDVTSILMSRKGISGKPVSYDDLVNNKKVRKAVENEFQQLIHSLNSLSRNAVESPFTTLTVCDEIKAKARLADRGWYFANSEGACPSVDDIVKYYMEVQKIFVQLFDKGVPSMGGMIYRFPVVTNALSKDATTGELLKTEWLKFITGECDITRYNNFISLGTKTTNCCRLLTDAELLTEGSNVQSLANVSESMGSLRVCTINFPRLAITATSKEDFFSKLDYTTLSCGMVLKAHRELISNLEKAGLQPFITNGLINLSRMYCTFGVIGIYECVKILQQRFGCEDVTGEILTHFKDSTREVASKLGFKSNIEQIPGETVAVRLADIDRIIFGKDKQPYTMYSNQFVPLWVEADAFTRLSEDGKYNLLLSGGGICHINCSDVIAPAQAVKILEYAAKVGCEHMAINTVNSLCEDKHYTRGKNKECPICSKKIIDYYTRVVGFFTAVSSWNPTRRDWEFDKRTFTSFKD